MQASPALRLRAKNNTVRLIVLQIGASLTKLRRSLHESDKVFLFNAQGFGYKSCCKSPRINEYSIPALLLDYGANIQQPHYDALMNTIRCENSHFVYLFAMGSRLEIYKTEYFNYLDMDSILDLMHVDRWLISILYHTFTDFRKLLNSSLGTPRADILPAGVFSVPELFISLKAAKYKDRSDFFNLLCAYGSKELLQPFIGAGFDMCNPLAKSSAPSMHLLPGAFLNIDTFSCLSAVGLRMQSLEDVLLVMRSSFILDRVQDEDFIDTFFGLWSPSPKDRPLVTAYWLQSFQFHTSRTNEAHMTMIDKLIARAYCTPSNSPEFLGVEIIWQVCLIIEPRDSWRKERCSNLWDTGILSHMIQQHHGFFDLELDPRSLPQTSISRWPSSSWVQRFTGYTPLMLAVVAGNLELVALLVDNGASITLESTSQKFSALDLSIRNVFSEHPRLWVLPGRYDRWHEEDGKVSEAADKKILDFLLERSGQSLRYLDNFNIEHTSSGKLLGKMCILAALTFLVEGLASILRVMGTIGQNFSRLCRKVFLKWRHRRSNRAFLLAILPTWLRSYTAYLYIDMEDAGVLLMAFGYFLLVSLRDILSFRPSLRYAIAVGVALVVQRRVFG